MTDGAKVIERTGALRFDITMSNAMKIRDSGHTMIYRAMVSGYQTRFIESHYRDKDKE